VVLDVALVKTERAAVWVSDALVYLSGLSFCLNVQWRGPEPPRREPLFAGIHDAQCHFGVELSDGRRIESAQRSWRPIEIRPDHPVLRPRGGGSGGLHHRADLWLWPLPPPGPLTFVFAWPAEGVREVTATVDTAPIIAASARAYVLWPDDRPFYSEAE
jgi:hypothetical protein